MSKLFQLDDIHFHDLPLDEIRMKLDYHYGLEIRFSTYDDTRKDYDMWSLQFLDIVSLNFDQLEIGETSSFEIFSFDYSFDVVFKGEMTCRTGFGTRDLTISFICRSYALNKIGPIASP